MKSEKRREFIKKSAMITSGLAIGTPAYIKGFAQVKPSEIINMAVIGVGIRGRQLASVFTKSQNTRVVAICDPDENQFPKAIEEIEKSGGTKPKTFVDYRQMLKDKSIDAVIVASPDYWHALHTISACQAGKDVYVEKPLSHTIEEGRKMIEAARKYKRIVQVGTQNRSSRLSYGAVQLLQDGIIGDVYYGRATVYGSRGNIGRTVNSSVPAGVNWDLFRGPAPMIPFSTNHFHYRWHWYWDTATGEFGNNGVHSVDRIRWGMNKNVHPTKIHCCGGFFAFDSDQEVPNLQIGTFEYDDGKIIECVVRSLPTPTEGPGILFMGTKGYMQLSYSNIEVFMGSKDEPDKVITVNDLPAVKPTEPGYKSHYENFIDCIKSREYQNLAADVLEGHMSSSLMLLGNISYRTGRKLIFDGNTEKFINDDDANTYLTKDYRKPYVLPKEV